MAPVTRSAVEAMDARDPLAGARTRFTLPADVVYLDGNSLGALPVTTSERVSRVVRRGGATSSAAGISTTGSAGRSEWGIASRGSSARGRVR
jgi:kynureninase